MIGKKISHYEILEKLGEGGMGVVYKARDVRLDRSVAMKFLPRKLSSNSEDRERFFREARAASALNHPGICTIHEIDESDGEMFLVMEYVDGISLRGWAAIRRGEEGERRASFLREAVDIAIRIAEALGKAHDQGILHRDVKSDNVMVTPDGRVKIMDFGLARFIRADAQDPITRHVVGTAQYMSPEQVEGRALDARSDIFSLGVVLYELFTNTRPFASEYDLAVLYSIVHAEPQPLTDLDPSLPAGLNRIVLRCLSKSAADRYPACGDLIADLETQRRPPGAAGVPGEMPPVGSGTAAVQAHRGEFIGREKQLRMIDENLEAVKTGRGQTVFITGESGIGKSRLVEESMARGRSAGMSVFSGRSLYQEAGLPYHPFVTALRPAVHGFDQHMVAMLTRRAASRGIDLTGRLPLLKDFFGVALERTTLLNKEQLWDAVVLLLKIVAEQPVILVIDDLQWADATTVGLFAYIARNIDDIPLLLTGVYRLESDQLIRRSEGTPLLDTVRQLKIEGLATQIDVERFTEEETTVIVHRLLDNQPVHSEVQRTVYEAARGNPLFVFELVNLMRSQQTLRLEGGEWRIDASRGVLHIPDRVQEVILRRIDRVSGEDREILDIASCEGEYFSSESITGCLGIERLALLKRLQALEKDHALIRHEKDRYAFDHPLIRHVLYDGILYELRQEYHKKIGATLTGRHRDDDQYASRIAHHLISAGQEEEALSFLLRAADLAAALHAHDDAMKNYRKVREILDRTGASQPGMQFAVEEGLGEVAHLSGSPKEAVEHFANLLALARRASDQAAEIKALRKTAESLRVIGDVTRAIETCNEAIALASRLKRETELVNCLNTLASVFMARGEYDRTVESAAQALELSRGLGDQRNESLSLCYLGSAHVHRGEYRNAVDRLEEARILQQRIGDSRGLATSLNYAGLAYHRLGDFERALSCHTESLRLKKSVADTLAIPGSLNGLGDVYRDIGDIDRAIALHTQSLALAREHRNRGSECDNIRDLGADFLVKGDLASARRNLEEVLALSRSYGYAWYEARTHITLGEMHLASGNVEQALLESESGLTAARSLSARELVIDALWIRAKVLARTGRGRESVALLEEAAGMARAINHTMLLWQLYRDLASLQRSGDDQHRSPLPGVQDGKAVLLEIVNSFRDENLKATFLLRPDVSAVLE